MHNMRPYVHFIIQYLGLYAQVVDEMCLFSAFYSRFISFEGISGVYSANIYYTSSRQVKLQSHFF